VPQIFFWSDDIAHALLVPESAGISATSPTSDSKVHSNSCDSQLARGSQRHLGQYWISMRGLDMALVSGSVNQT